MRELGVDHFYIELIEDYPCETIDQLRKKEGLYIREIGTLNLRVEGRTKEHIEENKDVVIERRKKKRKKS